MKNIDLMISERLTKDMFMPIADLMNGYDHEKGLTYRSMLHVNDFHDEIKVRLGFRTLCSTWEALEPAFQ